MAMFDDHAIQSQVESYLNNNMKAVTIPDGHTTALVVNVDLKKQQVTAALAKKVNGSWQVDGLFDWSHNTGFGAGVNVVYSK